MGTVLWQVLVVDLIFQREDCGQIWSNLSSIDCCAAVSKVDSLEEGLVVCCGEEVDPLGTIRGSVARVVRVS